MRNRRSLRPASLRTAALLAAACWPSAPASAQAEPATEDRPASRTSASPADVTRAALDEIIVTARRRAESLQRTPISVVALSAQDLAARSVTNSRTLQNFVPNLTLAPSQNVGEAAGNAFIRGIGQEDFSIGAEPGVGYYVDGVYFARTMGTIMNLIDVDRIEVLRGPQGTLFGKNAIGGVINILSNMPHARRERLAGVILGNFDRAELRAVSNEPLSDRLFMRLSLGAVSRDGYVRRLAPPVPLGQLEQLSGTKASDAAEGSERSLAARLQLRWLIGNTLTADVALDGSRIRNEQGATHVDAINIRLGIFPELNRLIREGALPGPPITGESFAANALDSYATGRNSVEQDFWGGSVVVTKDLGAHAVKFIGAYRSMRSHIQTDTDGLYFDITESDLRPRQHQLSAELQVSGTAGPLTYAGGLFWIAERGRLPPTNAILERVLYTCGCFYAPDDLPLVTAEPRRLRGNSRAVYAQGTYQLANWLSATLGARWSTERKTIAGEAVRLDENLELTDEVVATGANSLSKSALTYRAGVEIHASRDVMAYASLAKGFKSGGFNVRGSSDLPNMGFYSYRPETALTYELGLRSEWLDRRLRFNATVFHTDYRDIQLRQQTIIAGHVETLIDNAARARIRGAEVELTAAPFKGLTLSAGYGHLDPKYLDIGTVRGLTLGSRFQRMSRHSFSGSVNYQRPVGPGTLELHADYSFRSKEQFQILPAINDQPGYGLLGARVTFRGPDDRWAIAMFATNLTDRRYRTAGRGTLLNQTGIAYSSVGLPRQFGVQLSARF